MRAAAISKAPAARPSLGYGLPTVTAADIAALPFSMGTPVAPKLSFGLLPPTAATLGSLPYSLGATTAVATPAVPYISPFAVAVSPRPMARPDNLGNEGVLGKIGDVIGKALGAIFDPIAKALDAVFHPNGYRLPDGSLRDPKPEPTKDYSASNKSFKAADRNGDGHLDKREERDFRSREADRFDRQREENKANRDGPDRGGDKGGHDRSDKGGGGDRGHDRHRPILLDLDGNGVKIDDLSRSTAFIDAGGDGLKHRTAWAGAGDGVLFFDADNDGAISQKREYVFTEWDPTANSDMEALRSYFDTNGDGKLTAADADFAKFRVMVTRADGSQIMRTLSFLGITEINLTEDATRIVLPDGSVIEGQTTFKKSDGSTGTVASTSLVAETDGHRVTRVDTTDASGNRVVTSTAYDAGGQILYVIKSVASPTGATITNYYDDDGDGVTDRIQSIDTVTNANGSKTETIVNKIGAVAATAVLDSRVVTTRSVDGKSVVIERDSNGGGWFNQREVQTINADGSRTNTISDLGQNGTVIRSVAETISADGKTRTTAVNEDGTGGADTTTAHQITVNGDLSRTEVVSVTNQNGTLRSRETTAVSADGKVKTISSDLDGDGLIDASEANVIAVTAGATSSTITVKNRDLSLRSNEVHSQSADALTKTIQRDVDGDGDNDTVTVDQTVINADGSRVNTITVTNVDGSVRDKTKVTLGADKVTSETWVDLNEDGIFQATDLVKSVVVAPATQVRTATEWDRNADGSVKASTVTTTSASGLDISTVSDLDGDGDTDRIVTDVTTISSGVATQTITVRNQDNSLRSSAQSVTSADGLTLSIPASATTRYRVTAERMSSASPTQILAPTSSMVLKMA